MFEAIGDALRAIPGPTKEWAAIIGHVAWPLALIYLAHRFRHEMTAMLSTLNTRLKTDGFKTPFFEMDARTRVVPLDQDAAAAHPSGVSPADARNIEHLFEHIASQEGHVELILWIAQNIDPPTEVHTFIMSPEYATERVTALAAMNAAAH